MSIFSWRIRDWATKQTEYKNSCSIFAQNVHPIIIRLYFNTVSTNVQFLRCCEIINASANTNTNNYFITFVENNTGLCWFILLLQWKWKIHDNKHEYLKKGLTVLNMNIWLSISIIVSASKSIEAVACVLRWVSFTKVYQPLFMFCYCLKNSISHLWCSHYIRNTICSCGKLLKTSNCFLSSSSWFVKV